MAPSSTEPGTDSPAAAGPPAPAAGPVVHDTRRWSRDGRATPAAPSTAPARSATAPPAAPDTPSEVIDAGPLLRIGTMIRKVLEEVRDTPLDERARERVRDLRDRAVEELTAHLGPELRRELTALEIPLPSDEVPEDVELRIAQAQLVGWLEGLFQGAQMAFAAEQMAARSQLERIRHEATQQREGAAPEGQYL
ncbi:proteasome activator [Actinomycetospora rhizophila]|uniref:Bacterial proteasome activator n=1 Tax=Actinomycetospora rhizophila TaxID=1416876 RepID=A0ABV9ZFG0_9PSEU